MTHRISIAKSAASTRVWTFKTPLALVAPLPFVLISFALRHEHDHKFCCGGLEGFRVLQAFVGGLKVSTVKTVVTGHRYGCSATVFTVLTEHPKRCPDAQRHLLGISG